MPTGTVRAGDTLACSEPVCVTIITPQGTNTCSFPSCIPTTIPIIIIGGMGRCLSFFVSRAN